MKEPALQSCVCVKLKRGRGNGTCKGPEVDKTWGAFAVCKESSCSWDYWIAGAFETWYSAWYIGRVQWRLAPAVSFQRDEKAEEPGKQDFRGSLLPQASGWAQWVSSQGISVRSTSIPSGHFWPPSPGAFPAGDVFTGESWWAFGSPPFGESSFVEFIVPVSFSSPSAWNKKKVAPTCFESRANKALLQLVPL